jgi:hypothetical protein
MLIVSVGNGSMEFDDRSILAKVHGEIDSWSTKKVLLLYSGGSATTTSLHEPLTKAPQIGPIPFPFWEILLDVGQSGRERHVPAGMSSGPLWCQRYVVTRSFEESGSLTSQNGLVLLLRSSLRCTLWGNLWARSRDYIYLTYH